MIVLFLASSTLISSCVIDEVDSTPAPALSIEQARRQPDFIGIVKVEPKSLKFKDAEISVDDCWLENVKVQRRNGEIMPDFTRICFTLKNVRDIRWKDPWVDFACLEGDGGRGKPIIGIEGMSRFMAPPVEIHTISFINYPMRCPVPKTLTIGLRDGLTVKTDQLMKFTLPNPTPGSVE